MNFKDKYTTDSLKAEFKDKENNKKLVSEDAFLNAEMLNELIKELKSLRLKNG